MSRIHEALQHAAEQNPSGDAAFDQMRPAAVDGDQIAALAREPFPVEIAGARRLRAPHIDAESPAQPATAPSQPAEDARDEARPSVFGRIDARMAEKIVADAQMSPSSREQYRRLAAILHDAQENNGLKVVMIASALLGEGKTLTAVNVALTLSESYRRRVLLIDADLRKPTLHRVFQLNTTSGLIDGLDSQTEVKLVVRQISQHLWVLPAGRPTPDPMAGLTSDRMRRLLEEAREAFDWIIIDTPPLMMLPDAHLLTSSVDGAVVVVRANATPHDLVKRTTEIIGKDRVLGIVLNHATAKVPSAYGHYYLDQLTDGKQK
jgi:protein-tyrosine kinase